MRKKAKSVNQFNLLLISHPSHPKTIHHLILSSFLQTDEWQGHKAHIMNSSDSKFESHGAVPTNEAFTAEVQSRQTPHRSPPTYFP